MTGPGHKLFGMGLAVAVGSVLAPHLGLVASGVLIAAAYPGTTAPDWLEISIGSRRLIPHRTVTHWLMPWLTLLGISLFLASNHLLAGAALGGFALGGLSHWFGDLGTPMGVPVLHPARRVSVRLWRTGRGEYVPIFFAWVLAAGALSLAQVSL